MTTLAPDLTPISLPRQDPPSPYLELSVPTAVDRFRALAAALPGTAVHYAVKANPEPALLRALHRAGSRFDVASPAEVLAALDAGAGPDDLVYSNPVKRRADVAFAADLGVRLFVVDCSVGQAVQVLRTAATLGLDAAGVSFHVGSQQRAVVAQETVAGRETRQVLRGLVRPATEPRRGR